jgi:DNA modification methylase
MKKKIKSDNVINGLKKIKPKPVVVDKNHLLFNEDCINILKQIPDNSINLIITDPPYNIGLKYNDFLDKKQWKQYYEDLRSVINEISRILTDDGSLYFINYPETNSRMMPIIDDSDLLFKRWLTWHYPSNMGHSKNNYTRSQRSILFCTKTENNIFNKNEIVQPYKNPNVTKIKRRIDAGSKGRVPYDFLDMNDLGEILGNEEFSNDLTNDVLIFNLLKNTAKDRELKHPCQLPLALLKVFIKASSNEGDIVLDCFAGTFTTCAAAKVLNRKSIGIEINKEYITYGKKRLEKNG